MHSFPSSIIFISLACTESFHKVLILKGTGGNLFVVDKGSRRIVDPNCVSLLLPPGQFVNVVEDLVITEIPFNVDLQATPLIDWLQNRRSTIVRNRDKYQVDFKFTIPEGEFPLLSNTNSTQLAHLTGRFPFVFIFTTCGAFPSYVSDVIRQTHLTQDPDKSAIFLINHFIECLRQENSSDSNNYIDTVRWGLKIPSTGVYLVDFSTIVSPRTHMVDTLLTRMFSKHNNDRNLWSTSTLRFFYLENFMRVFNFTELIQVFETTTIILFYSFGFVIF
jgi:hypothetical protein